MYYTMHTDLLSGNNYIGTRKIVIYTWNG